MKQIFETNSPADTEALGARLASSLAQHLPQGALIAMEGEMGVGKTAFVRGFTEALGFRGAKSPTYTIVNEYPTKIPVFHFDMYRIEEPDDLYAIGFEDYLAKDGYLLLEWSENIREILPQPYITVRIERTDSVNGRRITVHGYEEALR